MASTTARIRLVAFAALACTAAALGLTACEPPPDTYVSLGDSYTSGPGIPNQGTTTPGCYRSDKNYPSVTKPQIRATKFVDVSCSGATTDDFYAPQSVSPGPANAPQLNVLDRSAKVVTVGIGGNDIGFVDIIKNCAKKSPFGPGCKPDYVHDGRDELQEKIDAAAPKIDRVLGDVKSKAPRAKVFLVGYPTILPETGTGCYPVVPILPSDVPYLRGTAKALNAMLQARAAAAGITYVDTAASSVGHDVCQSPTVKWVEAIVPTSPAFPVHPNAAGMRNTAADVARAVNAVVTT